MKIVNLFGSDGFEKEKHNESYSYSMKKIASVFGAKKLGFNIEVMDPKTFSCPYHYHTLEEELILVIEGEATVRCNGEFRRVKAGDLVFYGMGPDAAHNMYNHSDQPFKYFVLSSQAADEVCYYPDSNKKYERFGRLVTQNGIKAEYFKDEEDPAKYWPKEWL